jgi:hypothetical protein
MSSEKLRVSDGEVMVGSGSGARSGQLADREIEVGRCWRPGKLGRSKQRPYLG